MTQYRYSEETLRSDFVQIIRKPLSIPQTGISIHKRKVPFLRKPYICHVALISDGCDAGIMKDVLRCLTAVGYSWCDCRSDGQLLMKESTELMQKSRWIVIITSACSDDTYRMLIDVALSIAVRRKQKCIISLVTEKSFQEQFSHELYMFLQVQLSSSSWKDQMLSLLEKRPTLLQGVGFRDQQGRQLVHRMLSFTNLPVKWLPRCMTSVGELNSTNGRTSMLPYTFRKTKTDNFPPLDTVGPSQNGHQNDSGVGAVSLHGENSEDVVNTNSIKMSPHQNQAQPTTENGKLPEVSLQKQRFTCKMLEHDTDRCFTPSTFKIDHCALISARSRPYLFSVPFNIPDKTPDRGSWTRMTHPSPTGDDVRTPTKHKPQQESMSDAESWDKAPSTKNHAFESRRRLRAMTPRPVLFIYGLAKHNE
ncbi:uncharacterized protein [Haliotis asinina]|uniref:uncharacterized protein n=1 Tax=Haliotis asinina TaxID=109174 RepID=UPI003531D69D